MFSKVEHVMNAFKLPERMTKEWLQTFFKMETTLGLPRTFSLIKIPPWAHGQSSYVSIRCLENEITKNIYGQINAPFFTTSLNLTGHPPITNENEALQFKNSYAPEASFISGSSLKLSGSSSSIVFFEESGEFKMIREGRNIEAVKKQLQLF